MQLTNAALIHRLAVQGGENTLLRRFLVFARWGKRRATCSKSEAALRLWSTVGHHPYHDNNHDKVQRCSRAPSPHYHTHTAGHPRLGQQTVPSSRERRSKHPHGASSGPLFVVSLGYSCSGRVSTTIENDTTHHVFRYSFTQPTSAIFATLPP